MNSKHTLTLLVGAVGFVCLALPCFGQSATAFPPKQSDSAKLIAEAGDVPIQHPMIVDDVKRLNKSGLPFRPIFTEHKTEGYEQVTRKPIKAALTCATCHDATNKANPGLLIAPMNELCVKCHADTASYAVLAHDPTTHQNDFAKVVGQDKARRSCGACHSIHQSHPESTMLLADVPRGEQAVGAKLCAPCHTQYASLHNSLHATRFLREAGVTITDDPMIGECWSCHRVHIRPRNDELPGWAALLGNKSDSASVRKCTGCHSLAGGARAVDHLTHPIPTVRNIVKPGESGFMPLLGKNGTLDSAGEIVCRTCHVPHGRIELAVQSQSPLPDNKLRAVSPMLKAYEGPNPCKSCHGYDGLRRHLYYHFPTKRKWQPAIDVPFEPQE